MKLLTTGDGGMVWCRAPDTSERIRRSTRLGGAPSGFDRRTRTPRWWEVDPPALGRRSTMNDVAAAIGLAQLDRLPAFLSRRREIAAAYDEALAGFSWLALPGQAPDGVARTFYWVQTSEQTRTHLAAYLLERGIYTTFRYWPLHKTQLYRDDAEFPGADRAAASTLLLPMHQGLSDAEVEQVIEAVRAFAREPQYKT